MSTTLSETLAANGIETQPWQAEVIDQAIRISAEYFTDKEITRITRDQQIEAAGKGLVLVGGPPRIVSSRRLAASGGGTHTVYLMEWLATPLQPLRRHPTLIERPMVDVFIPPPLTDDEDPYIVGARLEWLARQALITQGYAPSETWPVESWYPEGDETRYRFRFLLDHPKDGPA